MKSLFTLIALVLVVFCHGQFGSIDMNFFTGSGINDLPSDVLIQADGKIVIAGRFTSYNSTIKNRILRLNTDGTIDSGFDIGTGFNTFASVIKNQIDGKLLIGGGFNVYNGLSSASIIRLNTDGTRDLSFVPGNGPDGAVYTLDIQTDGKVIIGGEFQYYNTSFKGFIARITGTGAIDNSFSIGSGFNNNVMKVVIQPDGKVLAGGRFTNFNGSTANYITRLNSNGSIDAGFNIGTGFNGFVHDIILQADGKIIIGGSFTMYNNTSVNRIVRLNVDGTIDNSFSTNLAYNGDVNSIILNENNILVGGTFTTFNGVMSNRISCLASNGNVYTAFNSGNGFDNSISKFGIQADGKIIVCGNFSTYNDTTAIRILRLNGECLLPPQPNVIIGNSTLCLGSSQTYSVTNDAGATSYTWSLPNGWSGTSTTNNITATAGSSGTISVIANNACGSSVAQTMNVIVNSPTTSSISEIACNTFTAPDGAVYTTSGVKTAVIPNAAGCDSTITINLTINSSADLDLTITQIDNSLEVTESGGLYQWYSCLDTTWALGQNQIYTPINNGGYFVVVTKNTCTDSSACFSFASIGINEINEQSTVVYPNPAIDRFVIKSVEDIKQIFIMDLSGRVIESITNVNSNQYIWSKKTISTGLYVLRVETKLDFKLIRLAIQETK